MRVVSLIASATEIVCALGLDGALVGRSHECDFPERVTALPRVTEAAVDVSGTSADIDRRVRQSARDALSIYRVDDARLASLAPDVVITQTQCEVCAVSLRDVEAALARRVGFSPRVVSLNPDSLADLRGDVRRVAAALAVPERGERLLDELEDRFARAAARAQGRPRRTTVVVEWMDPLMSAGNWTPTLVSRAGGDELFGREGRHSGTFSWEELRRADPEVLVVAPCGFDLARTRADLRSLTDRPGFAGLRAVREGRAYLADGNAYFNRPGPRVAETLEALVEMLHPETGRRALEGIVWEGLKEAPASGAARRKT